MSKQPVLYVDESSYMEIQRCIGKMKQFYRQYLESNEKHQEELRSQLISQEEIRDHLTGLERIHHVYEIRIAGLDHLLSGIKICEDVPEKA